MFNGQIKSKTNSNSWVDFCRVKTNLITNYVIPKLNQTFVNVPTSLKCTFTTNYCITNMF